MRRLQLPLLAVVAVSFISCKVNEPRLSAMTNHPTYRAGQVWRYANRPGEDRSTFLVLLVEREPKLGIIVHIRVSGLRLKGSQQPTGEIGHMPFAESAITKSMPVRISEGPPPSLPEGYRIWREAFEAGQAGIFTVSIAEGVSFVEKTLPEPPTH